MKLRWRRLRGTVPTAIGFFIGTSIVLAAGGGATFGIWLCLNAGMLTGLYLINLDLVLE